MAVGHVRSESIEFSWILRDNKPSDSDSGQLVQPCPEKLHSRFHSQFLPTHLNSAELSSRVGRGNTPRGHVTILNRH